MFSIYKKFLKQDPNNWMWLISYHIIMAFIIMLLTIKI